MSALESILILVGIQGIGLGWILRQNWDNENVRHRTISLIIAIAAIWFVSIILADFMGEKQIIHAFTR